MQIFFQNFLVSIQIKIVNSKDLDIKCWSALRYLEHCELCYKVKKCKLPEAIAGNIKLLETEIMNFKNIVEEKQKQLNKIIKENEQFKPQD